MPEGRQLGTRIKAALATFLLLLLLAGFQGWEVWPVTGWRLFSRLRVQQQEIWSVTWTDQSGAERAYPFEDLPYAYSGAVHVLKRFPSESPRVQGGICTAWMAALAERRMNPLKLTIYKSSRDLSKRGEVEGAPPKESAMYTCDFGGVITLR